LSFRRKPESSPAAERKELGLNENETFYLHSYECHL
jgi:hypothetical protein